MLLLRYPLVLQARAVSYEGECTYFLRHFAPRLPQGYEWFCVEYKFSPLWSQSRGTTKKNRFFFSNQNESMLKGTKPKCIICQNMENTEKYPHPAFPLLPPLQPHVTIIIRYYIKRPSNARILVGFHSWTVEGQTFRWRHIHKILLRCHLNRKVPLYRVSVQKQITADVKMWLEHQSRTQLCCVCHFFFLFALLWPHLCSVTEQKHGNMESICLPFSP